MPVYWFALLNIHVDIFKAILVFIVLHFLVYPASNGYNSYCDKDEKSIGGLKHPPKVSVELWYLVIVFDIASIGTAAFIDIRFALMIFIYLMVSKAYSWHKIRLKKFPVSGAITVTLFQGLFTYLAVQAGAGNLNIPIGENLVFGMVSTLFLLGSYPVTQIYQHEEDRIHGDRTLSMLLGINGTFVFASLIFFIASLILVALFYFEKQWISTLIYLLAILPVNIYFLRWYYEFRKGKEVISFDRTMTLNMLSSVTLSAAFILMLILR
ncbi:MAG: UbiA prenyltransferase family protein [Chitinophagales bacterium]|nr:UbiA prenyltransferase family protein [Chitinophagales bacterium]